MIAFSDADMELTMYGPYAAILRNEIRASSIIGRPFPPNIASYIAEGWICPKSLRLRKTDKPVKNIQIDLDEYLLAERGIIDHKDAIEVFSPNCKSVHGMRLSSQEFFESQTP
jgi:hypothetical protein